MVVAQSQNSPPSTYQTICESIEMSKQQNKFRRDINPHVSDTEDRIKLLITNELNENHPPARMELNKSNVSMMSRYHQDTSIRQQPIISTVNKKEQNIIYTDRRHDEQIATDTLVRMSDNILQRQQIMQIRNDEISIQRSIGSSIVNTSKHQSSNQYPTYRDTHQHQRAEIHPVISPIDRIRPEDMHRQETYVMRDDKGMEILVRNYDDRRGSHQPDYTQVSPAKLALRRHLSQEKLAQEASSSNSKYPPQSHSRSSSTSSVDLLIVDNEGPNSTRSNSASSQYNPRGIVSNVSNYHLPDKLLGERLAERGLEVIPTGPPLTQPTPPILTTPPCLTTPPYTSPSVSGSNVHSASQAPVDMSLPHLVSPKKSVSNTSPLVISPRPSSRHEDFKRLTPDQLGSKSSPFSLENSVANGKSPNILNISDSRASPIILTSPNTKSVDVEDQRIQELKREGLEARLGGFEARRGDSSGKSNSDQINDASKMNGSPRGSLPEGLEARRDSNEAARSSHCNTTYRSIDGLEGRLAQIQHNSVRISNVIPCSKESGGLPPVPISANCIISNSSLSKVSSCPATSYGSSLSASASSKERKADLVMSIFSNSVTKYGKKSDHNKSSEFKNEIIPSVSSNIRGSLSNVHGLSVKNAESGSEFYDKSQSSSSKLPAEGLAAALQARYANNKPTDGSSSNSNVKSEPMEEYDFMKNESLGVFSAKRKHSSSVEAVQNSYQSVPTTQSVPFSSAVTPPPHKKMLLASMNNSVSHASSNGEIYTTATSYVFNTNSTSKSSNLSCAPTGMSEVLTSSYNGRPVNSSLNYSSLSTDCTKERLNASAQSSRKPIYPSKPSDPAKEKQLKEKAKRTMDAISAAVATVTNSRKNESGLSKGSTTSKESDVKPIVNELNQDKNSTTNNVNNFGSSNVLFNESNSSTGSTRGYFKMEPADQKPDSSEYLINISIKYF